MDNEDLIKAIEQVAARRSEDLRMEQLRTFENHLAMTITLSVRNDIILACMSVADPTIKQEIENWSAGNGQLFANRVAQVVRILLRKELGIEP